MGLNVSLAVFALCLLASGVSLLTVSQALLPTLRRFLRSRRAAMVLIGLSTVGFLFHVVHLGEADFGAYRWIIFAAALIVAILSFWHAPDFLAVRGSCALYLLGADQLLDAGFMSYEPILLFAKAILYIGILIALWWAVSPFRARDALEWLSRPGRTWRPKAVGVLLSLFGVVVGLAPLLL